VYFGSDLGLAGPYRDESCRCLCAFFRRENAFFIFSKSLSRIMSATY
jgi:hypothetical protein